MLRTNFEEELNKLHNQFYSMGTQVSSQLNRAVRAFVSRDYDLAEEIIEGDSEINAEEISLETKSFEMIALQQPVSGDLRTIITVLKASSDLERVGDHAASIAKALKNIPEDSPLLGVEQKISILGEKAKMILDASLNAYIQGDADRAREIAKKDLEIDLLADEIEKSVLISMQEQQDNIEMGKDYILTLMHLERVGDFAKNVCEWVVYLKTGELIEL
ncbi:phosphate signaling complex protein PhoU [Lactovum miscens]|uniref:Phosphate-specific transport system accessory protein PhoU n=1 Tax=Lactovum miscens TaxID=190387 RepID=A0A841C5J9_9LACT|nr:phosphate signaling complex protein PhoU [Lactovum miscens]MBB5887547.1 phosphate transport system protein [Lactovum miscens]